MVSCSKLNFSQELVCRKLGIIFVRIRMSRIKGFTGYYLMIVCRKLRMIFVYFDYDNYKIKYQQITDKLHPVHPQILDILILTKIIRVHLLINNQK
jgi:hypothetical protein